jgi:hypothetical protein
MTARARLLLVLPLLFAIVAIGCGGKGRSNTAIIEGTITYKGTKLGGGNITYNPVSGAGAYQVAIGNDGTYMVTEVPPGDAVVTVETESVKRAAEKPAYGGKGDMKMSPAPKGYEPKVGTYVEIPAKYADKEKSGLKYTVQSGKQTKNWELTD